MTFDQHCADRGWSAASKLHSSFDNPRVTIAREAWDAATLAERERCAVICDEMQEHWCAYKDTAQLNGDIALSIAASGEPRAAEALAALIRTGGIRAGVKP